jgi:hypothetical protein
MPYGAAHSVQAVHSSAHAGKTSDNACRELALAELPHPAIDLSQPNLLTA